MASRAADGRFRAAADDHGYGRGRQDSSGLDIDVVAREGHRVASQEPTQHGEALLHPSTARAGIDAADLELVGVFAAEPDAEGEPARCQPLERRDLAGDRDGVAER